MKAIPTHMYPKRTSGGRFASSWRRLAVAVYVPALWFPSETVAQAANAPTGVASFELMAEYLSRGTGQWRAPVPPRDGGPDALGLWFERTAGGRLLELTVVIYYGDEIRTGLKGYW